MAGGEQPRSVSPDDLRSAVAAVESRTAATADLPPLSADAHEAARAGLRLLRYRPRSEHELRTRLSDAEHSSEAIDEAIERIRAWGLVDDAEFAAEWVRGRRRRRGKSRGALEHELRDKGVAEAFIAQAVEGIDEEDERERATELLRARLERTSADSLRDPVGHRRRLIAFLSRRGYPTGLALAVVDAELAARAPS